MIYLDDGFADHPKVVRAGGDAAWLFVAALGWVNRNMTGGVVPKEVIARLTDRKNPMQLARRLVEVTLFEPHADGFEIHDYAEWNFTIEAKRQARSEHARAAARARWGNAGSNARASGEQSPSNAGANAHAVPEHAPRTRAGARPLPPTPSNSSPPPTHVGGTARLPAGGPAGEEELVLTVDEALALTWRRMAQDELVGARERGVKIRTEAGFIAKAAERHQATHIERASKLLADYPDLTPAELAVVLEGGVLPRRHDPAYRRPEIPDPMDSEAFKAGASQAKAALRGGKR